MPPPVLAWLKQNPGWTLSDILVTHHHHDHVGGVEALKRVSGATVYGPAHETIPARDVALQDNQRISVLGWDFAVYAVPGHTLGHIAFYHPGVLFCGDTLFAAGCGRLFEGTPAQMHASLQRLAPCPPTRGCTAPMNIHRAISGLPRQWNRTTPISPNGWKTSTDCAPVARSRCRPTWPWKNAPTRFCVPLKHPLNKKRTNGTAATTALGTRYLLA